MGGQFDPKSNTAVSGPGCSFATEVGTSCHYGCAVDHTKQGAGTVVCKDKGGAKGVWEKVGSSSCVKNGVSTKAPCGKGKGIPCPNKLPSEIKDEQAPRPEMGGNQASIKKWEPDAKELQYHKLK